MGSHGAPNAFKAKAWDPATGRYSEEELPEDIQQLMSQSQQSRGSKRGREADIDPERAAKIAKGEQMVSEGQRLAREGHSRYQKGLKQLMACMPAGAEDAEDLPEHDR